jgi:hypothetical protein
MDEKLREEIALTLADVNSWDSYDSLEKNHFIVKAYKVIDLIKEAGYIKPSPASVEEIEDLIFESHGWNLAKGSRDEKELARKLLPLITPELTVKRDPVIKNASEVAGIYDISGDIDPVDYVRGLRRHELTLIPDEEIEKIFDKQLPNVFPKNREEMVNFMVDMIHIAAQAQLAADKERFNDSR